MRVVLTSPTVPIPPWGLACGGGAGYVPDATGAILRAFLVDRGSAKADNVLVSGTSPAPAESPAIAASKCRRDTRVSWPDDTSGSAPSNCLRRRVPIGITTRPVPQRWFRLS